MHCLIKWGAVMLLLHPIIQLSAIVLSCYVFYLGCQRFRILYLKQQAHFQWKRHVNLGTLAFCILLIGMAGGVTMVRIYWHRFFMTGIHGKVALVMIPFILFGFFSGFYMNTVKKKRTILPIIHGINNFCTLMLALSQIITGLMVYYNFVLTY
jgi:hypothetical protein